MNLIDKDDNEPTAYPVNPNYVTPEEKWLKKIAGLLAALAVLLLISVILQIVGLVGAKNAAEEFHDHLTKLERTIVYVHSRG